MTDWNSRKAEIRAVIAENVPPRIKLRIKRSSTGWLTFVDVNGQVDAYWRGVIEGLLIGRRLVATYEPDIGPQSCRSPCMEWAA